MNRLTIKNILSLTLFLVLIFFLTACTSKSNEPQTLEELKEKKLTNPSEYDKCLNEVKMTQEKTEKTLQDCISNKLEKKGYKDNFDCIMEYFDNPVCQDLDRYNAGIDASNECEDLMSQNTSDNQNALTEIDCVELIGK